MTGHGLPMSALPPSPAVRLAALWFAAGLLLAACATGPRYPLYTPLETAGSFGYSEQQTSADSYRVTYRAPIETTYRYGQAAREREGDRLLTVAYDLALRRAAELALANGYPAFTIERRDNEVTLDVQRRYDDPFFGPYAFYPPHSLRYGYPFYHPFYYPRYSRPETEIAAEVTLEVQFQRSPGPDSFDAQKTLDRLRTQYGG